MYKLYYWPLMPAAMLLSAASWADHPTVGLSGNASGPITTNSAQTLRKGEIAASLDFQFIDMDPVSHARLAAASVRDEDVHSSDAVSRTAINFSFGLTNRLSVAISLPWVERLGLKEAAHAPHGGEVAVEEEEHHDIGEAHHDDEPEGQVEKLGDARGRGDIQLSAIALLPGNWAGGNAALLFGIKAPTGRTNERSHAGNRLETELQPGSGSWDYSLGVAFSHRAGDWTIDSNILHTWATKGSQSTDLGNIFNYNLSLSHPLQRWPKKGAHGDDHDHSLHAHAPAVPHTDIKTDLIFEINGEWRDQIRIDGTEEVNSGGNLLYFSPGIRVNYGEWAISSSVSIPLENLNGLQSEPETRLLVRLSRTF